MHKIGNNTSIVPSTLEDEFIIWANLEISESNHPWPKADKYL
jgi:hypothetical protein